MVESSDRAARRIATMTVFADAWNDHDVDALMGCMSDDCVYEASVGEAPTGNRFVGAEAVRASFAELLARYPDARWREARHSLTEDFGVTRWQFTATAGDGTRIVSDGCDLLWFDDDARITLKSALRKITS